MGKSRQTISPDKKAMIALEAIQGRVTLDELAKKYNVHPNLVSKWKKRAIEHMPALFVDGRGKEKKGESAQTIDQLHRKVGQLQGDLSWLKERLNLTIDEKRALVDPQHENLSVAHQCKLLDLSRSSYYYMPMEWDDVAIEIMRTIKEVVAKNPSYGARRICKYLRNQGYDIGLKRTRSLIKWMKLQTTADPSALKSPSKWRK